MKKSKCEICGKRYETYPIIIDNNPLSIASLLEDETKPDGTKRTICKDCRDNLDKPKPLTKEKETTAGYIKTHYTNPYYQLIPSDDVRSAVELLKERYETTLRNKEHKGIIPVFNFDEIIDSCFPVFKQEKKLTEHIKTGYDIEDEMRRGGDSYDKEGQKQWVSLSWLKEEIQKVSTHNRNESPLDLLLSLLEE